MNIHMNKRWLNISIIDELIYKCDIAYRQLNIYDAPIHEILFKLNLQILSKLRIIKPIRDIGDYGPLKVNLEDSDYFYSLDDVNKCAVASRSYLAKRYLLPSRTQAVQQANEYGEIIIFFHSQSYQTMIKKLAKGNFSVQFAQGCLQYTKQIVINEHKITRNIRG